jgi:hypothetical protein
METISARGTKICIVFSAMVFGAAAVLGAPPDQVSTIFPSEVGGSGEIRTAGSGTDTIAVVELSGTRYEMGYWYGRLLAGQIAAAWAGISEVVDIGETAYGYAITAMWNAAYFDTDGWGAELSGVAQGCADGGHPEITFLELQKMLVLPDLSELGCGLFALWGNATLNGDLYQLRNLDWSMDTGIQAYPVVAIYNPTDGIRHAVIGFAGIVGVVGGGMNMAGLAVSEIMGYFCDDESLQGIPFPVLLRDVIWHDTTLDQALARMQGATRTNQYHYCVADPAAPDPQGRLLFTSGSRFDAYGDVSVTTHPCTGLVPFHAALDDVIYWKKHNGGGNENLYNAILTRYGDIGPAEAVDIAKADGVDSTVLSVVYHNTEREFWVAVAEGMNPAHEQAYVHFDLNPVAPEGEGAPEASVVFENVQNVALLNTWGNESGPSLTADGRELFFASRRLPLGNDWDLWMSRRNGGIWQTPELLPSAVNSGYETTEPEISPDGNSLFFSVKGHPGGRGGADIWMSQRDGANWLPMTNLGSAVNSSFDDTGPSISEDGTDLYFCRSLLSLTGDVYVSHLSEATWQAPQAVTAVNTLDNETNPQIAEHGQVLYFMRGTLTKKLMMSRRVAQVWQPPEEVSIPGAGSPTQPFVTADGSQLYFADRISLLGTVFGNGTQDVYVATRRGAIPRATLVIPAEGARLAGNWVTLVAELAVGNPSDVASVRFQFQPLPLAATPSPAAWTDIAPVSVSATSNPALSPPYRVFFSACDLPLGKVALRAIAYSQELVSEAAPDYITVWVDRTGTEELEGTPCADKAGDTGDVLPANIAHRKIAALLSTRQNVIGFARPDSKLIANLIMDRGALSQNAMLRMAFHNPGSWDPAAVTPVTIAPDTVATMELFYPDSNNDGVIDGTLVEEGTIVVRIFTDGAWEAVDPERYVINTVQNKVVVKIGSQSGKDTPAAPVELSAIGVYADDKGSTGGEVEVSKGYGSAVIACNVRDGVSNAAIIDGTVSVTPSAIPPVTENEDGAYTLFVPPDTYTVASEAPGHEGDVRLITVASMQIKSVAVYLQPIAAEGEGQTEGTPEGEGVSEGEAEPEGQVEGQEDGEGGSEGAGEGELLPHSIDRDGNGQVSLSELLRAIQFFNMHGFRCAEHPEDSEDGYLAGAGANHSCTPHDADYNARDWQISLSELLRLIQFFNMGGYYRCSGTEDGFCPGHP